MVGKLLAVDRAPIYR